MTINERVKEIRKAKSLTLEAFGSKLGVTKVAISNIEKGNRSVTDQMFRSICREFGVREAWLREGEAPMFQPEPVDEIAAICRRYGLDHDARIMIEKFVELPADQRGVILDYIRSVADAMTGERSAEREPSPAELEAQYKNAFDSALSTASSVSNTTGGTASNQIA